jgi:predicted aspartyl protease
MPIATPAPKPRAAIHFEREAGLCLINILVDNRPVQAYFDTGCAARGIAMTAAMAASARDQLVEKTNKQLEHQKLVDLQLGPVKLANVKVTIANGLSRPLVGPAILGLRNYRIDPVRQEINFDLYDD